MGKNHARDRGVAGHRCGCKRHEGLNNRCCTTIQPTWMPSIISSRFDFPTTHPTADGGAGLGAHVAFRASDREPANVAVHRCAGGCFAEYHGEHISCRTDARRQQRVLFHGPFRLLSSYGNDWTSTVGRTSAFAPVSQAVWAIGFTNPADLVRISAAPILSLTITGISPSSEHRLPRYTRDTKCWPSDALPPTCQTPATLDAGGARHHAEAPTSSFTDRRITPLSAGPTTSTSRTR